MERTLCLSCGTKYNKQRLLFDFCPVCKSKNLKALRVKKYNYIKVLQGYYSGYGWEDLTAEDTYKEIKQRLKEYRENENGTYRIITRRELIKEATA